MFGHTWEQTHTGPIALHGALKWSMAAANATVLSYMAQGLQR